MASLFCCSSIQPYRPQRLDHEPKFTSFMSWAKSHPGEASSSESGLSDENPLYAVQLVRQVNFGALESKRYFVPLSGQSDSYKEVSEKDLIQNNFQKLNSYKNFRCTDCNKFFEVNLYQKDPLNKHHWRANLARPSESIDL